jgi:hypothetical protein
MDVSGELIRLDPKAKGTLYEPRDWELMEGWNMMRHKPTGCIFQIVCGGEASGRGRATVYDISARMIHVCDGRRIPTPVEQAPLGRAAIVILLTLAEVAKLLHCSKAHVCNAVAGRVRGCPPIPAVSLGRRKLVRRETCSHGSAKTSIPVVRFRHRQNEAARTHKEKLCVHGTQREVSESSVAAGSACGTKWQAEKQSPWLHQGHDQNKAREEVAKLVAEERAKERNEPGWKFGEFVEKSIFRTTAGSGKTRRGKTT